MTDGSPTRHDPGAITLQPGTLWEQTLRVTERASASGAQQPIATTWQLLCADGAQFLVRKLAHLRRKTEATGAQKRADRNPFLPYDRELWVADVSPTHVCLLNKFNVIDHHLLVVTRAFIDQEEPLDTRDFAAMWACLADIDGLAFYNSGPAAGASQRHKHLQVVPLPLAPIGPRLPMEPLLPAPGADHTGTSAGVEISPRLPFRHAFVRHPSGFCPHGALPIGQMAQQSWSWYCAMLAQLDLVASSGPQPAPYNLLATREWMLMVPRRREHSGPISINALGFAGSFFVRDDGALARLEARGPLTALAEVTGADSAP